MQITPESFLLIATCLHIACRSMINGWASFEMNVDGFVPRLRSEALDAIVRVDDATAEAISSFYRGLEDDSSAEVYKLNKQRRLFEILEALSLFGFGLVAASHICISGLELRAWAELKGDILQRSYPVALFALVLFQVAIMTYPIRYNLMRLRLRHRINKHVKFLADFVKQNAESRKQEIKKAIERSMPNQEKGGRS